MNNLYEEWLDVKKDLAEAKKRELTLRNDIIESLNNDNQLTGSLKLEEDGYKIAIGFVIRNAIDEPVLNTIYEGLSEQEKNCIKFKPGLVAKEMKELEGNESIWEAIISKPGQPTLKIESE